MATIPELLDGHITLEVECIDRLYLNGYIGRLATGPELSMFMRFQLEKPISIAGGTGAGIGEIPQHSEDAGRARKHVRLTKVADLGPLLRITLHECDAWKIFSSRKAA
jgi:hypothetical protein